MVTVEIRIQDIEDKGKPIVPEFIGAKKLIHGNLQVFGILEKGMQGGGTSVSFCALTEDGTAIILETSSKLFHMMAMALQGAEQKFQDKKAKKN